MEDGFLITNAQTNQRVLFTLFAASTATILLSGTSAYGISPSITGIAAVGITAIVVASSGCIDQQTAWVVFQRTDGVVLYEENFEHGTNPFSFSTNSDPALVNVAYEILARTSVPTCSVTIRDAVMGMIIPLNL
jgi:hypothetical protein